MPRRLLSAVARPRTFAQLKRAVQETFLHGAQRAEQLKVRTYWETGLLIAEHLLLNRERADYGAGVIPQLAREIDGNERTLYECLKFAREFPILRTCAELVWGHYRLLCQVENPVERKRLLDQTVKHGWTCTDLESRVRTLNAAGSEGDEDNSPATDASASKLERLTAKLGTPGLHPLVARDAGPGLSGVEGLAVDLGFQFYRPLDPDQARRYSKGDIVRRAEDGAIRREPDATKADLFTYRATLRRVIDGDTLLVAIEVAPGYVRDLELRLRGIDCAELSTTEGKAAKRFVQSLFDRTTALTITTTKSDKYDRYLADVFLDGDFSGVPGLDAASSARPLFLNNVLLSLGHARRYDGTGPKPWAEM